MPNVDYSPRSIVAHLKDGSASIDGLSFIINGETVETISQLKLDDVNAILSNRRADLVDADTQASKDKRTAEIAEIDAALALIS